MALRRTKSMLAQLGVLVATLVILLYTLNGWVVYDNSDFFVTPSQERRFDQCSCLEVSPNSTSMLSPDGKVIFANESTCSIHSFAKGFHQKVLAFTYYEGETYDKYGRDYFKGIGDNLVKMSELYPSDFVMRLYFEIPFGSSNYEKLCQLACQNPRLQLCDIEYNPRLGNASSLYPLIWRFLPVLDPTVDLVFSRDLDSLPSHREIAAVQEFLTDGAKPQIHIMRDNKAHGVEMLGGTWGSRLEDPEIREKWRKAFKNMLRNSGAFASKKTSGPDQKLLAKYVYPWARSVSLAHDSYHCSSYRNSRSFPTERPDEPLNFVGSVASQLNRIRFEKDNQCPPPCRRKPQWFYC